VALYTKAIEKPAIEIIFSPVIGDSQVLPSSTKPYLPINKNIRPDPKYLNQIGVPARKVEKYEVIQKPNVEEVKVLPLVKCK
jgi:hypothetical protein